MPRKGGYRREWSMNLNRGRHELAPSAPAASRLSCGGQLLVPWGWPQGPAHPLWATQQLTALHFTYKNSPPPQKGSWGMRTLPPPKDPITFRFGIALHLKDRSAMKDLIGCLFLLHKSFCDNEPLFLVRFFFHCVQTQHPYFWFGIGSGCAIWRLSSIIFVFLSFNWSQIYTVSLIPLVCDHIWLHFIILF